MVVLSLSTTLHSIPYLSRSTISICVCLRDRYEVICIYPCDRIMSLDTFWLVL